MIALKDETFRQTILHQLLLAGYSDEVHNPSTTPDVQSTESPPERSSNESNPLRFMAWT